MTIYQTTIRKDLIELGRSVDGEQVIGQCYQVVATDKDGNRFAKYYGDDTLEIVETEFDIFDLLTTNVEALNDARRDAILLCGTTVVIDDDWFRIGSVYGSKAYEQRNEESDYLAFEQQQERERF